MKITPAQWLAQLGKNKSVPTKGMLLYGRDRGLADALIDALRLSFPTWETRDFASYREAAHQQSLFSTNQHIFMSKNPSTNDLNNLSTIDLQRHMIVLWGEGLLTGSKAVQMATKSPHWAAIPCYSDEQATFMALVHWWASFNGYTLAPNAASALWAFSHDYTIAWDTLHKASIMAQPGSPLTDAMVTLALETTYPPEDDGFAAFTQAILDRKIDHLDSFIDDITQDPSLLPGFIRAASLAIHRLLHIHRHMHQGHTIEQSIAMLKPPPHFKTRDALLSQIKRWPLNDLINMLQTLETLDIQVKTPSPPPFIHILYTLRSITQNTIFHPKGHPI